MSPVNCVTCAWFSPAQQSYAAGSGQCRRRAPLLEQTERGPRTIWPLVRETQWCGEHAEWTEHESV